MQTKDIIIGVLALLVVGLAYMQFGDTLKPTVSSAEIANTALAYINNQLLPPGVEAEMKGDVAEENGLYKFEVSLNGQEFFSYVTKDGKLFFPEGIDLTAEAGVTDQLADDQQAETSIVDVSASAEDRSRGNLDAQVTIIEFSDLQCSYCARFHGTMKQVMENYPTQVRWVYKHFPLDSIHPYARKAAEASECSGDQGKFWEYTDSLYENQSKISPDYLVELAQEIGLETTQFEECLDSGKYADKVDADYQEGRGLGVSGTPGSFINGQVLGGAVPYESLASMIDELLNAPTEPSEPTE